MEEKLKEEKVSSEEASYVPVVGKLNWRDIKIAEEKDTGVTLIARRVVFVTSKIHIEGFNTYE